MSDGFFFPIFGLPVKHKCYTRFPRIKYKTNGKRKVRWITAPCPELKAIQRAILVTILYRYSAHPAAHGYVNDRNVRSNSIAHCKYKHTITIDLKNFFPTISVEMVRKTLCFLRAKVNKQDDITYFSWSNASMTLAKPGVASKSTVDSLEAILDLCTLEGSVPQGAPTSGAIANLIMYPLDELCTQVANEHSFIYTRYADDLAFSGNDLSELKRFVFGYLCPRIEKAGFTINKEKVHVGSGDQRIITGMNVHSDRVTPVKRYRRKIRARLAKIRNEISRCVDKQGLCAVLDTYKFLRKEFGHLWYLGYSDSMGQTYDQWVKSYFEPILLKVQEFHPNFGHQEIEDPNLIIAGVTKFSDSFTSASRLQFDWLSAQFVKLENAKLLMASTSSKIDGMEFHSMLSGVPWGSVSCKIKQLSKARLPYRFKRLLVAKVLAASSNFHDREKKIAYTHGMAFTRLYRYASPEDRKVILNICFRHLFGQWSELKIKRILKYARRLNPEERFELLKTLDNPEKYQGQRATLVIIEHLPSLFVGLSATQTSVLLCSDNSMIRQIAARIVSASKMFTNTSQAN